MKDVIIILGAGVMQGPIIKIAKELGLKAIALDGSREAPCISMADQFEQIDLKNKEEIESFARSLQNKSNRLGIMTAGTDFSASVAWVSEKLGLPGIPYETALNASDKSRMRECFKKASLPSPDFFTITKNDKIENYSLNNLPLPFPLVIKPVDNMGSRGCRRVDNMEEFNEAVKIALGFSRSGRAIIESYMDGPEFSVDAIVCHGEITICGLADRHIFFPPYFIEMGHTMPTEIEKQKQDALLETFCEGVKALGICEGNNIGAAKGDIKLTEKGPMIGEIAARLSGGYMSGWTYPYSSGAQPIKGAILSAMGEKPEGLVPFKTWTCAERAFISIPGTVNEILGIEQAKTQDNINDIFLRIKKGGKVSFPENNVSKCGNILASAPDRQTAITAAENAAHSIHIRLDPNDAQTAEFLGITDFLIGKTSTLSFNLFINAFPPNAFKVDQYIIEGLAKLPDLNYLLSNGKNINIYPFPEFTSSGLTDYMGRTINENLEIIKKLTGFTLTITPENAENELIGRSFWTALIRGSYQGAVYLIDNISLNQ